MNNMKYFAPILTFTLATTIALADFELTVDIDYPRHLELKIPVRENSAFEMRTSFIDGEFFAVTGHVGRITTQYSLTYGYTFKLGGATGSATGEQYSPLDDSVTARTISSIYSANPRFVIRSVPAPQLPKRFQNKTNENAQQAVPGYDAQGASSPEP